MRIGYARVSTIDQNHPLQLDALRQAGCERVVEETASGGDVERPQLKSLRELMRAGDVLVVWKLDRLSRSLKHLVEVVEQLRQREIGFKCLTHDIDTTTASGKLVFGIFAALAEFERELISEHTRAGLKAARARSRMGGRRPKLSSIMVEGVRSRLASAAGKGEVATMACGAVLTGARRLRAARARDERLQNDGPARLIPTGDRSTESPRVCRRLQLLRDWSHDERIKILKVLRRGARSRRSDGV